MLDVTQHVLQEGTALPCIHQGQNGVKRPLREVVRSAVFVPASLGAYAWPTVQWKIYTVVRQISLDQPWCRIIGLWYRWRVACTSTLPCLVIAASVLQMIMLQSSNMLFVPLNVVTCSFEHAANVGCSATSGMCVQGRSTELGT